MAEPTPLQVWTQSLFDLLTDAKQTLDRPVWEAFISIACDRIGHEAAANIVRDLGWLLGEQDEAA